MKHLWRVVVVFCVAYFPARGLPEVGPAPGGGHISTDLMNRADLVCAGRVQNQRDISKQPQNVPGKVTVYAITREVVMDVDRCYKGDAKKVVITYSTHESGTPRDPYFPVGGLR